MKIILHFSQSNGKEKLRTREKRLAKKRTNKKIKSNSKNGVNELKFDLEKSKINGEDHSKFCTVK